ncbi:MAG: DUF3489 domain-containing protein [Sandaracinobacter sp.]
MTNSKPKASARSADTMSKIALPQPIATIEAQAGPNHSRQPSKLELIRSLLSRHEGVSLDELVSATRWQPHSVRAGMTGLRKQGLTITREKVDGTTRFAIEAHPVEAAV